MTNPESQEDVAKMDEVSATVMRRLQSVQWDFEDSRLESIHGIHPYPARFIPQIPRELIRLFYPGEGAVVLDPFCGSGTTLVEAMMAGIPSIGIDVNPLACLISRVKTTRPCSALGYTAHNVVARAQREPAPVPEIPRIDHWFLREVQDALARLVNQINQVTEPTVRDALRVALSRIIVRVSNQESDVRYAAVRKSITSEEVYSLFLSSVQVLDHALYETFGKLFSSQAECTVMNRSTLDVAPREIGTNVGLVITSPPYPNAYEYWLYHKYRMYWLGMDPIAVRSMEIGARAHYFKKNHQTEKDFEAQMERCFSLLSKVMRRGAMACFLVGRSIIHGRWIDNEALLKRAASRYGFRSVGVAHRKIRLTRKAFNPRHGNIDQESILVLVSEGGSL